MMFTLQFFKYNYYDIKKIKQPQVTQQVDRQNMSYSNLDLGLVILIKCSVIVGNISESRMYGRQGNSIMYNVPALKTSSQELYLNCFYFCLKPCTRLDNILNTLEMRGTMAQRVLDIPKSYHTPKTCHVYIPFCAAGLHFNAQRKCSLKFLMDSDVTLKKLNGPKWNWPISSKQHFCMRNRIMTSQLQIKFKEVNLKAIIIECNFQTVASRETIFYETQVSTQWKVVSLIIASEFDLQKQLPSIQHSKCVNFIDWSILLFHIIFSAIFNV